MTVGQGLPIRFSWITLLRFLWTPASSLGVEGGLRNTHSQNSVMLLSQHLKTIRNFYSDYYVYICNRTTICCSCVRFGVIISDFLEGLQEANTNTNVCGYQSLDATTDEWHPQSHKPTCGLFCEGKYNYCYMQYKHWNHNQWEPQVSPGIQLLQVNIDLVDKHVVGTCLSNTFSMIWRTNYFPSADHNCSYVVLSTWRANPASFKQWEVWSAEVKEWNPQIHQFRTQCSPTKRMEGHDWHARVGAG